MEEDLSIALQLSTIVLQEIGYFKKLKDSFLTILRLRGLKYKSKHKHLHLLWIVPKQVYKRIYN